MFAGVIPKGYEYKAVIPFPVNWQVKESVFGLGSPVRTDFYRLMKIIERSGYRGDLPVETLAVKEIPYDPFVLVPAFLNELKLAMND